VFEVQWYGTIGGDASFATEDFTVTWGPTTTPPVLDPSSFSDDTGLLKAIADQLATDTGRPFYVVELPVDAGETMPYGIVDPIGGQWDRGMLERPTACGWYGVQIRSIGKGADVNGLADYLWLAGKVRVAFDQLVVAGSGWTASDGYSQGPASGADTAGRLSAVAEHFEIYVQPA
jgi:hypothetical protein